MLLFDTISYARHSVTGICRKSKLSNVLSAFFLPIFLAFFFAPQDATATCYVTLPPLSENNDCVEAAYAPYSSYGDVEYMWAKNVNGDIQPVTGWSTNTPLTFCPEEEGHYRMCARKVGCQTIYETGDVYVNPDNGGGGGGDESCYKIKTKACGKFLDIEGGSTDNGAKLIQWPDHGGLNQRFSFEHLGNGAYRIVAKHSGKVLQCANNYDCNNGTEIAQGTWNGSDNQKWYLYDAGYGYYFIKSKGCNKYMDFYGNCENGSKIELWPYYGDDYQKFKIIQTNDCCTELANAGSISGNEINCEPYNPGVITGTDAGAGIIYQWQEKTTGSWNDIAGATSKDFDPGYITESTWYRRKAKNAACGDWLYSNNVDKHVKPAPNVTSISRSHATCSENNGSITFNFTDEASRSHIEFSIDGGATYPLWVPDNSGSASFHDLAPGTYELWVRWGNNDCPMPLGNKTINANKPAPEATVASVTDATCDEANGTVTFTFTDNPSRTNIEFSYDGGVTYPLNVSDASGSATLYLGEGSYDLWVRWGNNDCPVDLMDVTITNTGSPLTDGGSITGNQVNCEPYDPDVIIGTDATGGSGGSVMYQWQQKITGSWTDIPGATSKDYDPGFVTESIWFRRKAKRSICDEWLFSNNVDKHVKPGPQVTVSSTDPDCGEANGTITFAFVDEPSRTNIEFSWDGGMTYPRNVSDASGSTTIDGLPAGTYDIYVRWGNNDCPTDLGMVTISEPDADNDNVCDADDCAPNDPNFPALPGNPCDDGDPNTENDTVTPDGCGCAGTPVDICDNTTSGGTIGLGAGGFFNEEETCDPCSVPIIQSNSLPSGGSGALEMVWIKRPMSESLQDCQDAFSEMAAYNVGELYDAWVANGSDPNNSQIGNTSWMFVTDGDADDSTLTLDCLEESTCFVRCARRENCTPFAGESNFVRIEINAGLNGGTLGVTPPQGGDPYLGGAAICAGDAVPVIATSIFDAGFTGMGPNGETLEFVWLQTSNANDPAGAFTELAGLNVGILYNTFVQNGMVDPNIYGTSWKFATDTDGNDLTLSLANLDASAAFVRCARVVGDTRFCGESSFASITVETCAPAAPSCTYERCDGVATITGVSASGINLVRILDADQAGLPIVYECGTFLGQQCGDPIVFDLPNPNGSYIVSIVCDDGNHYEYLNESCGGALVENDNTNEAQSNRAQSNDDAETVDRSIVQTIPQVSTFNVYPNPTRDRIFVNIPSADGKAADIEIYNNLGQRVILKTVDAISEEAIQIDLPGFTSGIYMARVTIDGQTAMTKQFVVNANN
jgi:hypothetical protein